MLSGFIGAIVLIIYTSADGRPSASETITNETLKAQIVSIAPIVEKHAHRKFSNLPPARVVSREQLEEILVDDIDLVMKAHKIDLMDNIDAALDSLMMVSTLAQNLLAKYALTTDEIVICPEAMALLAKKHQLSAVQQDHLLRLTLAHELVHALCDQEFGYEAHFARIASSKAKQKLFVSMNEGFACVLTRLMKDDLGIAESMAELEPRIFNTPVVGRDMARGTEMMAKIYDRSGIQGMWEMLQDPIDFEVGDAHIPGNIHRDALKLPEVSALLGCANPLVVDGPPTQAMNFFRMLEPATAAELNNLVKRGYSAICTQEKSPRTVAVSMAIYVTHSNEGAERVGAAIPTAAERIGQILEGLGRIHKTELAHETGHGPVREVTRKVAQGGMTTIQTTAWIVTGPYVIQLVSLNREVTGPQLTSAFTAIAGRLAVERP